MDPIEKLRRFETTAGVTLGVVFEELLTDWLRRFELGAWLDVAGALAIIALTVVAIRVVLDASFASSRIIRRLILGRHYIEGAWFDVMHRGDRPTSIGVSRLEYEGSALRFSGFDFDLETRVSQPYTSEMAQVDWPHLDYRYDQKRPETDQARIEGYGRLTFVAAGRRPTSYSGDYYEISGKDKVSFEGFALDPKNESHRALLESLDASPERRKRAMELFFFQECPSWARKWQRASPAAHETAPLLPP